MQQADRLEFFAGDVVRRLKIIPKARPSLLGATATVACTPPMARPDGQEAMRAGVISAPEGSTLTLKVTASQNLASAADAQGKPLRVKGAALSFRISAWKRPQGNRTHLDGQRRPCDLPACADTPGTH